MAESTTPATAGRFQSCEDRLTFRHVLVPLDGSRMAEHALPLAGVIARGFGARTTLLRVLAPPQSPFPVNPLEWEVARTKAERYLEAVAASISDVITPNRVVDQGRPAQRIIEYAQGNEIDLIVIHSHGEGGPSQWWLSETAQLVVGSAVASVLVVPLTEMEDEEVRLPASPLRRVLLALDCSPRAECVLPVGLRIARETNAEVVLCHIVEEPDLPRRLGAAPEDVELAGRLVARNVQEATKYLERVRTRVVASGIRCETRVQTASHAAEAIRDLAARERADLVVICAHGGGGTCGAPHGSVASALAQHPPRPLLVVQDARQAHVSKAQSPQRAPIVRGD